MDDIPARNSSSPDILNLPPADVLKRITDVHCHPTDAPSGVSANSMHILGISICAMSSMESDQGKVKALANAYPDKVVPAFGYHPWFSHLISTPASLSKPESLSDSSLTEKERHYRNLFLPNGTSRAKDKGTSASLETQFQNLLQHLSDPRPLTTVLAEVRANLTELPNAMLGEVGLDRVFRVPVDYFASPRILTPFQIPLEHQVAILEAQLELAVELGRNVSMHSVKSQQATVESLDRMKTTNGGEKWNRISVDMHSCGLSAQTWRDLEKKHENVFLSLSDVINHKHANHKELIGACNPDRILVESDYNDIDMVTSQTWEIIKVVAEVRGWSIETEWDNEENIEPEDWGVVRRLERNWLRFKNGNHAVKQRNKRNGRKDFDSEGSDSEEVKIRKGA